MPLTKEETHEIVTEFGENEKDTGTPEVQVALLTRRIKKLTSHLQANPKDHSSRRGLLKLVGQRRRLLNYLIKNDLDAYRTVITELGLRK